MNTETPAVKVLEIRDHCTMITALAVDVIAIRRTERIDQLLARVGYGDGCPRTILLARLVDTRACSDPYNWGDRTMLRAHLYIADHWEDIDDGGMVDVRQLCCTRCGCHHAHDSDEPCRVVEAP